MWERTDRGDSREYNQHMGQETEGDFQLEIANAGSVVNGEYDDNFVTGNLTGEQISRIGRVAQNHGDANILSKFGIPDNPQSRYFFARFRGAR